MPSPFSLAHEDGQASARAGKLNLSHGKVETPFFMPVATKGSVKHLTINEASQIGYRCLIANAFIFYLRPGLDVVERAGGIHSFMGWKHNLFTDSGGFQILDEGFLRARTEEGVVLNNPFTKKPDLFTPERCMEVQMRLGSDVAMCLDDVPRFGEDKGKPFYAETLQRTLQWAQRCRSSHESKKQLLFGISQGGTFLDLRKKGLDSLKEMGFDGMALGGLAIGEPKPTMQRIISLGRKTISADMPLYVMGLGTPEDIIQAISNGADIFDSAFPTRTARHGLALTSSGRISIRHSKYASDFSPLDLDCSCLICHSHSRAFLHHLSKNNEESGARFLTHHNLAFLQRTLEEARTAIRENEFHSFATQFLQSFHSGQVPSQL
ncbi:MAG: tRNA guanosine(34) transglycosylase Tgt [Candidatus Diapherotrites archaeon]|nr:tRNA guanosine(34) transglycosylase Tgt [Candidatus Diapherotrites archaeon]MDZ4256563.1 tRNA guanosine(34) transglycosylase Tgt [archaeon]